MAAAVKMITIEVPAGTDESALVIYDQHGARIQYNVIPPGPGSAISGQSASPISRLSSFKPIGSYEPPDAISAFAARIVHRATAWDQRFQFSVEDLAIDAEEITRNFPNEVTTYRVDYSDKQKLTLDLPSELAGSNDQGLVLMFTSGHGSGR